MILESVFLVDVLIFGKKFPGYQSTMAERSRVAHVIVYRKQRKGEAGTGQGRICSPRTYSQ